MEKKEIVLLSLLFIASMYFWSLPFLDNPMPYSEVDGAHHFALADYQSMHDTVIDTHPYYYHKYFLIATTPSGKMMHTPQYFLDNAIAQVFGGDRVLPFFLMTTFLGVSFIFALYFVLRQLFDIWVAFFTSLLSIFSGVDIFTHIMGQWPAGIAFAITPVIGYCYYKYVQNYLENKEKPIYLYLIPFLLMTQFAHFQALLHSGLLIVVYSIFIAVRKKKLFFNYKNVLISLFLVLILLGPLMARPLSYFTQHVEGKTTPSYSGRQFSAFFDWYSDDVKAQAFPKSFFSYSFTNGLWTLPFFFIGLAFLLYRRKEQDFLLLSWFIAVYIILHLDVIMGGGFAAVRIARSINDLAHVLYPIIIIGVFALFSLGKSLTPYYKYIAAGFIIIMIYFFNFANASSLVVNTYPQPLRMNPSQYAASQWLYTNTLPEENIITYGTFYDKVSRWMRSISQRNIYQNTEKAAWERYYGNLTDDYIMVDYSDAKLTNNQQLLMNLASLEQQLNLSKVYNTADIKIYKVS